MSKKQLKDFWIKCGFWAVMAVLGLILLVNPDWAVTLAVKLAGWACLAIGVGFIISMIVDQELNRVGKWVLAILGIIVGAVVIAFPLVLADTLIRFFGLVLLNIGIGDLRKNMGGLHRGVAIGTLVAGVVLVLVPRTLTHTLLGLAGIVLIIVGAVNIYSSWQDTKWIEAGSDPNIIDADE